MWSYDATAGRDDPARRFCGQGELALQVFSGDLYLCSCVSDLKNTAFHYGTPWAARSGGGVGQYSLKSSLPGRQCLQDAQQQYAPERHAHVPSRPAQTVDGTIGYDKLPNSTANRLLVLDASDVDLYSFRRHLGTGVTLDAHPERNRRQHRRARVRCQWQSAGQQPVSDVQEPWRTGQHQRHRGHDVSCGRFGRGLRYQRLQCRQRLRQSGRLDGPLPPLDFQRCFAAGRRDLRHAADLRHERRPLQHAADCGRRRCQRSRTISGDASMVTIKIATGPSGRGSSAVPPPSRRRTAWPSSTRLLSPRPASIR